jgi:DNA processing protein
MAVPGNVLSGRSGGAHALIRDGAKIVEAADDILEEIGLGRSVGDDGPAFVEVLDPVLKGMEVGESVNVDGLTARSGLGAPELLRRLTEPELEGRVIRTDTSRFVGCPSRW